MYTSFLLFMPPRVLPFQGNSGLIVSGYYGRPHGIGGVAIRASAAGGGCAERGSRESRTPRVFFDTLGAMESITTGARTRPCYQRLAATSASTDSSLDVMQYRPAQPYVMQFQFAVQRQLGADTVAELNYTGSRMNPAFSTISTRVRDGDGRRDCVCRRGIRWPRASTRPPRWCRPTT